jgi:hypothetical protein
MSVSRREVLEALAAATSAVPERTTTVEALAADIDADEAAVTDHLDGLRACELACQGLDGQVRVTLTGEELLALETDDLVVVDAGSRTDGRNPRSE